MFATDRYKYISIIRKVFEDTIAEFGKTLSLNHQCVKENDCIQDICTPQFTLQGSVSKKFNVTHQDGEVTVEEMWGFDKEILDEKCYDEKGKPIPRYDKHEIKDYGWSDESIMARFRLQGIYPKQIDLIGKSQGIVIY
jgi:hypothetical protein